MNWWSYAWRTYLCIGVLCALMELPHALWCIRREVRTNGMPVIGQFTTMAVLMLGTVALWPILYVARAQVQPDSPDGPDTP